MVANDIFSLIQAIDITDPNPISLLMLCVQLYFTLPQYIPKSTVEFIGALHDRVLRQVRIEISSLTTMYLYSVVHMTIIRFSMFLHDFMQFDM